MSQGRRTQVKLHVLTALTLAVAVAFGFSFTLFGTRYAPAIFILLAAVTILGIVGVFAHRCPRCGLDVTKDAHGVRTHKSWPKVNERCAACGTELS